MSDELTVTRGTYVHEGATYPDTWMPAAEVPIDLGATIRPVMDHTFSRGVFPWPARWWREGEFLIPLNADLDEPTWGLVMAELFAHLADDEDVTAEAVLRRSLEKQPWELHPGLQVVASDGGAITTGCCAGLSRWRDWYTVLDGARPFLGHDPHVTAWLEAGRVVVREAMHLPDSDELVAEPAYIALSPERFREQLDAVGEGLSRMAERVGRWAAELTRNEDIAARMRQSFASTFAAST